MPSRQYQNWNPKSRWWRCLVHGIPILLLLSASHGQADVVGSEEDASVRLDHVIDRIDRLEFYRLEDFGPPDSACHACLYPQHVNCNAACYSQLPSLSFVCSQKIRGLSIGPFDREERGGILAELFKTDTLFITTLNGDESLDAYRISSEAGMPGGNFAIDIEGLDGLKNTLTRASTNSDQFSVRVGMKNYTIPITPRIRDAMYRFLKQCPD